MLAWRVVLWICVVLAASLASTSDTESATHGKATAKEHTGARKRPHAKPRRSPEKPMQVYIVRSGQSGCEPNCPEWIAAEGKIETGTLEKFKIVLKRTGDRGLPVFLHSGGGSVSEAMAIGRLLREKGLDTVVTTTVFTPCEPTDNACRAKNAPDGVLRGLPFPVAACASSCTFVLAAGKRRFVGPVASVGVHRIKTLQTYRKVRRVYQFERQPDGGVIKKLLSEQTISRKTVETKTGQEMYDTMAKYFAEMGVGKEIVAMFKSTPNSRVRWLNSDELKSTGLSTEMKDGLALHAETLSRKRRTGSTGQTRTPMGGSDMEPGNCKKVGGAASACVAR